MFNFNAAQNARDIRLNTDIAPASATHPADFEVETSKSCRPDDLRRKLKHSIDEKITGYTHIDLEEGKVKNSDFTHKSKDGLLFMRAGEEEMFFNTRHDPDSPFDKHGIYISDGEDSGTAECLLYSREEKGSNYSYKVLDKLIYLGYINGKKRKGQGENEFAVLVVYSKAFNKAYASILHSIPDANAIKLMLISSHFDSPTDFDKGVKELYE